MTILGSDPFSVLLYQQGFAGSPLVEGGANGADQLDVAQRSITVGDVVPIVFCRRVGEIGGVLISPGATEARFENNLTNEVTASYHVVLGEGVFDGVQVRDVFQRSCRVGTFSQTYNRRAGPWLPGNFIVDRGGSYVKPECPYYCGTGGTYEGMTTGSYVIENVPDRDSRWDRQIHLFIRGGMHVTRLLDSVEGPSNNISDLVLYLMRSKASRTPAALIDIDSLTDAADFTDKLGLWFNGELNESANIEDFFANYARDFLLTKVKRGGKIGLRPLLPVTAGNLIDTAPIVPAYTFTESHVKPGSFDIKFVPLSDRKLFCALILWRQQPTDDVGIIRTTEVRYAGTAIDGPFEQHDLSIFCASENHAVKSGAYKVAKRRYVSHTLRIKTKPGVYNGSLVQGDVVRVRINRTTSSAAPGVHDYLYEVDRIGKSRTGEVAFDLIHFPVDDLGRSLVALDVVAATGGGLLLSTGKSGTSCDVNADDDVTVPPDDSLDPSEWELPGNDGFGVGGGTGGGFNGLPNTDYGTGTDIDGDYSVGFDGGGGGGGGGAEGNPPEELDDQDPIPGVGGVSPGGPIPGDELTYPGCGCEDGTIEWFLNGEPIGSGSMLLITPEMMSGELEGRGRCPTSDDECSTGPIPVPVDPTVYSYWRFVSPGGTVSGWNDTSNSYGAWVGPDVLSPGGIIPWFAGGGQITVNPPFTSAGGNLGGVFPLSIPSNAMSGAFLNFFGGVIVGTPYDMGAGGSWQFANSSADTSPDGWELEWGGVANPNDLPPP